MRRGTDTGAAAVEYALIIGLLVIGLIGAINRFEDNADNRYDERSTQGDPAEEFGNLGPSGGGSTGGSDGSTPPGGSVTAVVVEALTATAPASNNTWSMTVTVRVTGDGQPLGGVVFTAPTWSPPSGGTSSCTTTSSGVCTYTQSMARTGSSPVETASFTLGTPSFTNPDGSSPTFSGPGVSTISCTKPTTGSGTGACA
jgi:Flp pilus assembly pilin Flp